MSKFPDERNHINIELNTGEGYRSLAEPKFGFELLFEFYFLVLIPCILKRDVNFFLPFSNY